MQAGGVWLYSSSHPTTAVCDTGFFSDGQALGMRPGDLVFITQWTTLGSSVELSIGVINKISTAGAASVSTSARITSS
jgi:hypothetical protein